MDIAIVREQFERLITLLQQPDVDVCWSSYSTAEDAVRDLEKLEPEIIAGNRQAINRMKFLLAPTGDLQEISISSGWGYEFLGIAETIEKELVIDDFI